MEETARLLVEPDLVLLERREARELRLLAAATGDHWRASLGCRSERLGAERATLGHPDSLTA